MTAPQATEEPVALPSTEPGGLHRPMRAVVALVELVAAGVAVWGAFWAWPKGFATITTPVTEGVELDSQRVFGNWLALAILFGTVAAVLVIDALRQTILAARARPKRAKRRKDSAAAGSDTDTDSDTDSDADSDTVPDSKVTGDD